MLHKLMTCPDLSPTHYVSRTELLLFPAKTLLLRVLLGCSEFAVLDVSTRLSLTCEQPPTAHAPRLSLTPLQPVFLSYFDGLSHRHSSSEIGKCRPCQR